MIALSDQTYIFIDAVLRASSQITTDLVAQSAPNLVWTLTEERKRAGLTDRKHLNGLRFKFAERQKRD